MMQLHNFHLVVIQCYCNPFKLTEVIFFFPLKHSFCWALLSLPYVLSQFIFSFHLLTLSLFKVSLFSFICLIPLTLASSPSKNKQDFKKIIVLHQNGCYYFHQQGREIISNNPWVRGISPWAGSRICSALHKAVIW